MAEINEVQEKPEGEVPAEEIRRLKAVTFANRDLKNKKYRFADKSTGVGIVGGSAVRSGNAESKSDNIKSSERRVKLPKRNTSYENRPAGNPDYTDNSAKHSEEIYRKAAYIKEMLAQEEYPSTYYDEYYREDNAEQAQTEYYSGQEKERIKSEKHTAKNKAEFTEYEGLSPEIADRMKKAAFIRAKLLREKNKKSGIGVSGNADNSGIVADIEKAR